MRCNVNRSWAKRMRFVLLISCAMLILSGCMYPKSKMPEYQVDVRDAVAEVEAAIDKYFEKKQTLPIINRELETDNYDRYSIDFRKLTAGGYLSQIPTIAFENGGAYKFVMIDPDGERMVKLMDLEAIQTIGDLQLKINAYHDAKKTWPIRGELAPGYNIIDFELLNEKSVQVRSPYSSMFLGCMLDENGQVWIDYAPEIMIAMNNLKNKTDANLPDDLRELLITQAVFVPAVSVSYQNINNEPIPVVQDSQE